MPALYLLDTPRCSCAWRNQRTLFLAGNEENPAGFTHRRATGNQAHTFLSFFQEKINLQHPSARREAEEQTPYM